MPFKFEVLGPFPLNREGQVVEIETVRKLWSPNRDVKGKVFRYAVGVYIFAVKQGTHLLPIYVGKTDRGFAYRLNKHTIYRKIEIDHPLEEIQLFLLASVTTKRGELKRAKRVPTYSSKGSGFKSKRDRAIDELEFSLIGRCLGLNQALLNQQEKSFHNGLLVPGYLPGPGGELNSSAIALQSMLT